MDNITFQGGFLIKKPSKTTWNSIQEAMPRHKCLFQDFNGNGDKFFAIKSVYDEAMARVLLRKRVGFKFYPDINLKSRLDTYYPEEAHKIVDAQTNVIETKDGLKEFLKTITKKPVYIKRYHWKPEDHIDKTFRAAELNPAEHTVSVSDHITYIKDKSGKVVAKASPNNERGVNFVYIYPKKHEPFSRRLAVNEGGEVHEFSALQTIEFQKLFMKNVRMDMGRKRPQK